MPENFNIVLVTVFLYPLAKGYGTPFRSDSKFCFILNILLRFYLQHTAPQHRQYLNYEGIGMGSPSRREKQYSKFKAMRAVEHVIDYKVKGFQQDPSETSLTVKERVAAKKIRTR